MTSPAAIQRAAAAPVDHGAGDEQQSLVVQTSFIGDTVLTTPLIAELARRGPVDVVVAPASAPLLANHPAIRNVIVFDKQGAASGLAGLWRTARRLRALGAPSGAHGSSAPPRRVAYLAQQSMRSALLALLGDYPERVGFDTSPARALYTRRVPYRGAHHAQRLLSLAATAEASAHQDTPPAIRPRLYPAAAEQQAVNALLRVAGIDGRFIAMAPGSVWATKRWPYFAVLAQRLAAHAPIVVVGGADDAEAANAVLAAVGTRAVSAAGRLSLLASAELIGRASILVTNDSSPQHLASAMNTPTVTVFGPTVPRFGFGPLAERAAVAELSTLPCRPCHHHGPPACPLGHWRCMRDLGVAQVEALVTSILN